MNKLGKVGFRNTFLVEFYGCSLKQSLTKSLKQLFLN